jgi:ribosomal protein S12 methylthiotransferase accessory factor
MFCPYTITLNDAFKTFTLDQDKITSPEETVSRFRQKLKNLDLDILAETVRIDTGRLGIPVFFSRCGKDASAVIGTRKQMGKGATPAQSEASAVMELAERFSFFSFVQDSSNFITATYRDVKAQAMPFSQVAQSVHDESEKELSITRSIFETLPMKWTWGYNLTRSQPVLVPFDWFYTINEFNGPSAGNCQEEALSQGICEIVERHVSSLISRNRLQTPAINPESVTDALVREMLGKYKKTGIRLAITDFSLDTGIASVGVLAYDPATFPEKSEIIWTAGTTPDPQKALSRALTEVAQLAGDFNTGANYVASGLPKFRTLAAADFVLNTQGRVNITALPDLSDDNIRVEVQNLLAALSRNQMEVIAIDTGHRQLAIPAFYTIVPGAHFRERAAGTSVGMFSAKIIANDAEPNRAYARLTDMDARLPGKYYVQFYLGSCRLKTEDPKSALHHFQKALELSPMPQDLPSIYSYMGVCLKDLQDYGAALAVLEKALACDAERTDIHNLMGYCHFKQKAHAEAIACFEKVLAIDPGSAIDYANIGVNYRAMGQREKAVQYFELALSMDPDIDFARAGLDALNAV